MIAVRCPRCAGPVRGLRSTKHIAMVLPCHCWVSNEVADAITAKARAG